MDAKKCDRCGKFYDKYNGPNLIVIGEEGGLEYDYEEKIRCELCPDCMGQMIFHLKNGGPDE